MVPRTLAFAVMLLVSSVAGSAAQRPSPDLNGAWSGSILIPAEGKRERNELTATFKHAGEALAGALGPNAKAQIDIAKGHVESTQFGTSVTFDLPGAGFVMHFELRLSGNVLRGIARLEGEKGVAQVELQRNATPSERRP